MIRSKGELVKLRTRINKLMRKTSRVFPNDQAMLVEFSDIENRQELEVKIISGSTPGCISIITFSHFNMSYHNAY
jgi:hypothetical protein